jgi:hypothetical protein
MAVDKAVAPFREKLERETEIVKRYVVEALSYNAILGAVEFAITTNHRETARIEKNHTLYLIQLDKLYLRLFFATITNRPLAYLGLVRDQVIGAWNINIVAAYSPIDDLLTGERRLFESRKTMVANARIPLTEANLVPDTTRLGGFTSTTIDLLNNVYMRIRMERWLVYLLGVLTFLAIPFALFRPSRDAIAAGYCGVMIHGSILLTCTTTVFIARYAAVADPLLLVCGAILFDGAVRWLFLAVRQAIKPIMRPETRQLWITGRWARRDTR